jgi:NitT/TauT family transport system ATP-binding protein
LSALHACNRRTFEIKLPRPRELTIKRSSEFVAYVDRIWRLIEDDVRHAVIHEHV